MNIDDLRVGFRPAQQDDWAFILDSWIESYRLAHAAGPVPMDMYRKFMREIIVDRIIWRQGCATLVAFNESIPSQILGWVCCEIGDAGPIIWYVDVKQFARRQGLATELIKRCGISPTLPYTYLFKTKVASDLNKAWPGGRWDPIGLRKALSDDDDQQEAVVGS